jgi:predicted dehydrogenase
MQKTKIGIVGCGNISGIYFKTCKSFEILDVAAAADLIPERARAKAREFGVPKACSVDELLADPDIRIVVNLTIPKAHAPVALAALKAGKCVHNEKPLALAREDGRKMLALARRKGLRVGCAPDTFMGAAIQTCRKLIDEGAIGQPIGASAFMTCHGHESWHPAPEFYYKPGGGPMFDMGPYYLTALVALMGPVRRVTGSARATFAERLITSLPKAGTKIAVEVPTHVVGVMDFAGGAIGTIMTSFDVWAAQLPRIEIYGAEGTMEVPDPNGFGGQVRIRRPADKEWVEVCPSHSYAENSRGIGVADMACALRSGRPHRASGDLAYHVLDVMHAFHDASSTGRHVTLKSTCDRPAPLPTGLKEGTLDA